MTTIKKSFKEENNERQRELEDLKKSLDFWEEAVHSSKTMINSLGEISETVRRHYKMYPEHLDEKGCCLCEIREILLGYGILHQK